MTEDITRLDFAVLGFIRENLSCTFLDLFLSVFTFLGNGGAVWIGINIFMLSRAKHRRAGAVMAAALVISLIVGNLLLKNLVARERPFVQNPDIFILIPPPSGYSFPSGHSFSSFAAASVLGKYSRKAALPAFISASLIAFSRLYFCVHFPSDVLCGAVFGIITGISLYGTFKENTYGR